MSLPAHVTRTLERLSEGVARGDVATRAAAISEAYRSGGASTLIKDATDALAYALVRMPATFAAVSACFDAINNADSTFAPRSLLDVGAGPGTATWAAAQIIPSLRDFALLDANSVLRDIAHEMARGEQAFAGLTYRLGDATAELRAAPEADLVVASYAIGELDDVRRNDLVERMWARTTGMLLIVEPGTPDGYSRIIAARKQLIAAGARVAAPCPHDAACPLTAPDWCHFAQRLPRSRDHMHLKNASVPFEDEKFSYIAVSRTPAHSRKPRVLAPVVPTKIEIAAKLCLPGGQAQVAHIPRRDRTAYAAARRWRWGDTAG